MISVMESHVLVGFHLVDVWLGRRLLAAGICAWTVVNCRRLCLAATRTAAANELVPVTSFASNVRGQPSLVLAPHQSSRS